MKKILYILVCSLAVITFLFPSYAEETTEKSTTQEAATEAIASEVNTTEEESNAPETTVDESVPRLMAISYEVSGGMVTPGKSSTVKVTIKNQSNTKSVKNIKLSMEESTNDIKPVGMGTQYVSTIYAGGTYVWQFDLIAANTSQIGEHQITINMEYEDAYFGSYSASDTIRINVEQSVALDFDGAKLPPKVVQGDTVTTEINLMNTGKTDLRNCKIDFSVKGLESGGTVFVGEIPAGESAVGSANLRVSSELLGDISGKFKISYEDAYGKTHSKTADLSTTIIKKAVAQPLSDEEEKAKYPLWWAFLSGGLVFGGAVGSAIPIAIYSSKQRREDEKRL